MAYKLPDGYTVRGLTQADLVQLVPFLSKFRGENVDEAKLPAEVYGGLANGTVYVPTAFLHGEAVACGIVYAPSGANRCAHIFQAYAEPFVPADVTAYMFDLIERWARMLGARGITAATRRRELRVFYEKYRLRPVGVVLERLFET